MNYFVGGMFAKQKRDAKSVIHINEYSEREKNQSDPGAVKKHTPRGPSLACDILESAYYRFQPQGYDKTTIQDICSMLVINTAQFYTCFESLDEVLEILWSR